jgi:hypothetical protein
MAPEYQGIYGQLCINGYAIVKATAAPPSGAAFPSGSSRSHILRALGWRDFHAGSGVIRLRHYEPKNKVLASLQGEVETDRRESVNRPLAEQ